MRLPNFHINVGLNELRRLMGADRLGELTLSSNSRNLTVAEFEVLMTGGIDIQSLDEVRVLPDGTLAYKDRRVLLYIRDVSDYGNRARDVNSLPKFHVSNCKKLQDMRSQNRFGRYVVAARQDGNFQINRIGNGSPTATSTERLLVCQFCLGNLSFNGFSPGLPSDKRKRLVHTFSLKVFFSKYDRDIIDAGELQSETTAPLNDYTGDFGLHATAAKERSNYRCENCMVNLQQSHLRRFLHAHHLNAIKYDNSPGNLKALCIACHAEQPGHSHMRALPMYGEFLRLI